MDIWQDIHWFALHAKACREPFAADNVRALGVEVFLPQLREERVIRRCRRTVSRPLFAGYLFARFCPRESLETVRHAHGVVAVLSTGRFPIPVSDAIIAGVRSRLAPDGFVRLPRVELPPGGRVRIEEGAFAGWFGRIERECDDGRRVALLLEALDHARILIEKRCLAAAPLEDAA